MATATLPAHPAHPAQHPVTVADLELSADGIDPQRAAAIYREHGCLVIRGLMTRYTAAINRDVAKAAHEAIALLPQAKKVTEGWVTPDGSLFLPAPAHFGRAQQIMLLPCNYRQSSALFRSALDETLGDLAEAIIGPDVELFLDGQIIYKEGAGGHPKHLHQDAAYFEHRYDGPLAVLTYCVDTDLTNGALQVVPGSHLMGVLPHVNTFSHLGLDPQQWPWERALPITGQSGDAILFHVKTIHGSKENLSPRPRPVVVHRFRAANDYVTINATTAENRSDAERQAEKARKQTQRGLMVRGYRSHSCLDEG
ncbi:MAG: phytanoyl-CoA dioxygenase family protein [Planctomycetes bacterium]|nr:phytanoyl-CoA dioxygenase family protein [Planctomycetota bacterium]